MSPNRRHIDVEYTHTECAFRARATLFPPIVSSFLFFAQFFQFKVNFFDKFFVSLDIKIKSLKKLVIFAGFGLSVRTIRVFTELVWKATLKWSKQMFYSVSTTVQSTQSPIRSIAEKQRSPTRIDKQAKSGQIMAFGTHKKPKSGDKSNGKNNKINSDVDFPRRRAIFLFSWFLFFFLLGSSRPFIHSIRVLTEVNQSLLWFECITFAIGASHKVSDFRIYKYCVATASSRRFVPRVCETYC